VTHGGFLMKVLEVYRRRAHPEGRLAAPVRPPFNCEMAGIVLGEPLQHGHLLDFIPFM
jgi:hypothetical protein